MSYNGKIDFGLLADYDSMEDVGLIAEAIEAEIKELLAAAEAQSAKGTSENGSATRSGSDEGAASTA
jgi:hypothetical protein